MVSYPIRKLTGRELIICCSAKREGHLVLQALSATGWEPKRDHSKNDVSVVTQRACSLSRKREELTDPLAGERTVHK